MVSERDIVAEARELAADTRYDIQPVARSMINSLADEVERLTQANKELKKCDACERDAIDRNCRQHRY